MYALKHLKTNPIRVFLYTDIETYGSWLHSQLFISTVQFFPYFSRIYYFWTSNAPEKGLKQRLFSRKSCRKQSNSLQIAQIFVPGMKGMGLGYIIIQSDLLCDFFPIFPELITFGHRTCTIFSRSLLLFETEYSIKTCVFK